MKGDLVVEDKQPVETQPAVNPIQEFEQHLLDRFTKIV